MRILDFIGTLIGVLGILLMVESILYCSIEILRILCEDPNFAKELTDLLKDAVKIFVAGVIALVAGFLIQYDYT